MQIYLRCHSIPTLFITIDSENKIVVSNEKQTKWTLTQENYLKSPNSDFVLDVNQKENSKFKVGDLTLWIPSGKENQKWKLEKNKIYSCMDSQVLGLTKQGKLEIQKEEDSDYQLWDFLDTLDTNWFIRSRAETSKFLSVDKENKIVLSNEKKMWILTKDKLLKLDNGLVLDINQTNDKLFEIGKLILWKSNGKENQKWEVKNDKIYSCLNNKLIGISKNGLLEMQDEDENSDQVWDFIECVEFDLFIRSRFNPSKYISMCNYQVILSENKTKWTWTVDNYLECEKNLVLDMNKKNEKTIGELIIYTKKGTFNQKWKILNDKIYSCADQRVIGISKKGILEMQIESESNSQIWDIVDENEQFRIKAEIIKDFTASDDSEITVCGWF
jgi:hypothetical protein